MINWCIWIDSHGECEFRTYGSFLLYIMNWIISPLPHLIDGEEWGGGCGRQRPLGLVLVEIYDISHRGLCNKNYVQEARKGTSHRGHREGVFGTTVMTTATTTTTRGDTNHHHLYWKRPTNIPINRRTSHAIGKSSPKKRFFGGEDVWICSSFRGFFHFHSYVLTI